MRQQMKEQTVEQPTSEIDAEIIDTPLSGLVDKLNEMKSGKTIYLAKKGELIPYPDKEIRLELHTGEKREIMKDSIKQDGILDPALVWLHDGVKYIMAGHNRVDIGEEIGVDIPYILFNEISKEKADRIVIVTNLYNRQYNEMLPSELVHLLDRLMKSYDETETKEEIYKDIDSQFNLSKKKVIYYLKLKNLLPQFMDMLDAKNLSFNGAYALSGIELDKQQALYNFMTAQNINTVKLAEIDKLLKRKSSDWDEDFFKKCFGLIETKKPGRGVSVYKIKRKSVESYLSKEDIEKFDDVAKEAFSLRKEIKEIFEQHDIDYNEDMVLKIIQEQLN